MGGGKGVCVEGVLVRSQVALQLRGCGDGNDKEVSLLGCEARLGRWSVWHIGAAAVRRNRNYCCCSSCHYTQRRCCVCCCCSCCCLCACGCVVLAPG